MDSNSPWTIGGWAAAALILIGVIIRQIGPWRKQITDLEEKMRAELTAALAAERVLITAERASHMLEFQAFQRERDDLGDRIDRLERRNVRQQIRHNAERALARHQISNITACFDAMILLIETNPDKSPEIIVKVKEMRATQILAEAEEKAAIRAAEITLDEGEMDHDGN